MSLLIPRLYRNPDLYGSRGLFAPTDLGAALVFWLNADDHGTANMTDDGAGLISAWVDRVGGLTVTAATTARPTWSATAFVGRGGVTKAGLSFDGVAVTGNCLTGATTGLPVSSTPGSIVGVATGPGIVDANARNVATYGGTAGGTFRRLSKSTANLGSASDGTISASSGAGSNSFLNAEMAAAVFAATTVSLRANGVLNATTGGATLNTGTTRLRIGASTATTAASLWLGVIRHVFITTALTTLQEQQLDGWIAWDSELVGL